MIKNPLCENAAGCGKWEPPMIANPEYKGKWRAPLIDNPNYQGKWSPKKIQNPDFFEDNDPFSRMTTIVCYMPIYYYVREVVQMFFFLFIFSRLLELNCGL